MGRAEAPPPGAAPTARQGSLRSEKLQSRKAFHPEGSGQLLPPGRGPLRAGGGGWPGSATLALATGPLHLPRQAARSEDLGNAFCSQRRLGGLAPLFLKELRPHACFTHTCSSHSPRHAIRGWRQSWDVREAGSPASMQTALPPNLGPLYGNTGVARELGSIYIHLCPIIICTQRRGDGEAPGQEKEAAAESPRGDCKRGAQAASLNKPSELSLPPPR